MLGHSWTYGSQSHPEAVTQGRLFLGQNFCRRPRGLRSVELATKASSMVACECTEAPSKCFRSSSQTPGVSRAWRLVFRRFFAGAFWVMSKDHAEASKLEKCARDIAKLLKDN